MWLGLRKENLKMKRISKVGIDKIQAYTEIFSLGRKAKFRLAPNKRDLMGRPIGEVTRVKIGGKIVRGESIRILTPDHMTIFVRTKGGKTRLYLNFNPSKILYGHNLNTVGYEEFIKACSIIKQELDERDIFIPEFQQMPLEGVSQ